MANVYTLRPDSSGNFYLRATGNSLGQIGLHRYQTEDYGTDLPTLFGTRQESSVSLATTDLATVVYGGLDLNNANGSYYDTNGNISTTKIFTNYTTAYAGVYMGSPKGSKTGWKADDSSWQYNLGWGIDVFGTTYSTVYVSSNGFLQIGGSQNASANNNSLANLASGGYPRFAPLWDDLMTNGRVGNDIWLYTANQEVTFAWEAQYYNDSSNYILMEATLFGNIHPTKPNCVRFGYTNLGGWNVDVRGATVGFGDGNGSYTNIIYDNTVGSLNGAESIDINWNGSYVGLLDTYAGNRAELATPVSQWFYPATTVYNSSTEAYPPMYLLVPASNPDITSFDYVDSAGNEYNGVAIGDRFRKTSITLNYKGNTSGGGASLPSFSSASYYLYESNYSGASRWNEVIEKIRFNSNVVQPSPSSSPTPTPTPTPTPSSSPDGGSTPTASAPALPTPTPTPTVSSSPQPAGIDYTPWYNGWMGYGVNPSGLATTVSDPHTWIDFVASTATVSTPGTLEGGEYVVRFDDGAYNTGNGDLSISDPSGMNYYSAGGGNDVYWVLGVPTSEFDYVTYSASGTSITGSYQPINASGSPFVVFSGAHTPNGDSSRVAYTWISTKLEEGVDELPITFHNTYS